MESESKPLISLIFPVKNEGVNLRNTLDSAQQVKTHYPFEMIVVDDGSADGCCDFVASYESPQKIQLISTNGIGLARAKNLGADRSAGDYIIFCDAHLIFEDWWIDNLIEPIVTGQADGTSPGIASFDEPDVVGCGQTLDQNLRVQWNAWQETAFPSAVLPGGCFAVSRNVFFDVGGFDDGFRVWGYEDVEISLKIWLFGYRCLIQPKVKILHLFRQIFPYTVVCEDIHYNLLRMAYSHFSEERIERCKQVIKDQDGAHIEKLVLESNVLEQRRSYFSRRKYDDHWFMKKFGIPF